MKTSTWRVLSLVIAGVAAVTVVPGTARAVAPDPGPAQSTAAFRANIPASYNPFTDENGDTFENEIECVAALQIALGGPGGRPQNQFAPSLTVPRDQMASFIARQIDAANNLDAAGGPDLQNLPPYNGTNRFTDVPANNAHLQPINRLAVAGVVNGKTATTFDPSTTVTRAQVASFINRAQAFLLGQNPANAGTTTGFVATAAQDFFTDDEGSVHEANINGIAAQGIYVGVNGDTAAPNVGLPRNQMGALLCRHLAVNHAQGRINPAPTPTGTSQQVFTLTGATAPQQAQGSSRTCSVAVPAGTVVDLELFPSANLANASGTNVLFRDADSDNRADTAATTAVVTLTSGAPASGARIDDVTSGGTISFTIGAPAAAAPPIDVTAVVYRDDATDNDLLDLQVPIGASNARKMPAEQFGVGCRTVFVPAEAAAGTFGGGSAATGAVGYVDKTEDFFTVGSALYEYDSNDTFTINGAPQVPGPAGLAAFESAVSAGDAIGGTYAADPAAPSSFTLNDVAPVAPVIADGGSANTTARIDVTGPAGNENVDSYRLQRCTGDNAACSGGAASFAQVADVPAAGSFPQTLTDTTLSPGTTYTFRVVAVDDGDTSPVSNLVSFAATAPPADTTGPSALDTELVSGPGNASTLDNGDQIVVCFSEPLQAPTTGASASSITVQDADGTTATITNGSGASFTLVPAPDPLVSPGSGTTCPANQSLAVTLTATPTGTGGTAGIAVTTSAPVGPTISDAAFLLDLAGNPFRTTGSADLVVDAETGAEPN